MSINLSHAIIGRIDYILLVSLAQSKASSAQMSKNLREPLSIYIHIPFCSSRCTYCAFNVYTDLDHLIPPYVDALCAELRLAAAANPYPQVHTVYFGGGTPSLLPPLHYSTILMTLSDSFALADDTRDLARGQSQRSLDRLS